MKYNQRLISAAITISSLMVSGYIVAGAQTTSTGATQPQPAVTSQTTPTQPQITFPIAELGNCADQTACKAYCDVEANQQACLGFAQAHGLMKADEVSRARKMLQATQNGGPGGCKTKDSCESYCSSSAHASKCIAFAEKNGLLRGRELEEAKKVLPLLQSGQTPGGCTTKDTCDAYCSDSSHTTECVNFAEKAGFISPEEAAMVRKTGGKGPGGCTSRESCDAFCNQKENQQTCFNFAKEHDLIPADQLKQMEEGTARLRVGLSQMPGEVVQCLKDKLGPNAVGQIESGRLVPSKDIGDTIQACFNEFKPQMAAKMQEGLKNAPPQVATCLQNALGADGFQKLQQGQVDNPEIGDKVKSCFEEAAKSQMQEGLKQLNSLPRQAKDCIAQQLGGDFFTNLQSGNTEALKNISQDKMIKSVITGCMSQFQGGAASGTIPGGMSPERIREMMQQQGASGTFQGQPSPEQIKRMMEQRRGESGGFQGNFTPEQLKKMMEQRGENSGGFQGALTPEQIKEIMQQRSGGRAPSPEELQKMMQRGGPVAAPGVPANVPTGPTPGQMGPTPQQIQNMMQGQIPQNIPQTAVPPQQPIQQQTVAPTN